MMSLYRFSKAAMTARIADVPETHRIDFRVGINVGDIIVEDEDIYGDGVNIAARLQGLAEPGGICVALNVYNHAKWKVNTTFADIGEREDKNIANPVRVYQVKSAAPGRRMSIFDLTEAIFKQNPELSCNIEDGSITVALPTSDGFSVSLSLDVPEPEGEFVISFDGWFFGLENECAALNCFAWSLTDRRRLKVEKRGDRASVWDAEFHDGVEWNGAFTRIYQLFVPFWRKKSVEFGTNEIYPPVGESLISRYVDHSNPGTVRPCPRWRFQAFSEEICDQGQ
jgi:hypothetical protein